MRGATLKVIQNLFGHSPIVMMMREAHLACQTPLRTDAETPLKLTPPIRSVVGLRRAEKPGSFLLS
jgi:hypothetical protein